MLRLLFAGALLSFCGIALLGCDDDPAEPSTYVFTIVNNDTVPYEVWIDVLVDTEGYAQDGIVEAGGTRVFRERTVSVRYSYCLVEMGPVLDPGDCTYEREVSSNGPDYTWNIPAPTP